MESNKLLLPPLPVMLLMLFRIPQEECNIGTHPKTIQTQDKDDDGDDDDDDDDDDDYDDDDDDDGDDGDDDDDDDDDDNDDNDENNNDNNKSPCDKNSGMNLMNIGHGHMQAAECEACQAT
jgi:hypothetical protein